MYISRHDKEAITLDKVGLQSVLGRFFSEGLLTDDLSEEASVEGGLMSVNRAVRRRSNTGALHLDSTEGLSARQTTLLHAP